ncbi:MAG TPA: hypothetical protein VK843_01155 [Planctomycetota bacterium]|nr:hypothetical protein [Planctomycetota bacterium]
MWYDLRKKLAVASLAAAAVACALILVFEARRGSGPTSWSRLSIGLGIGSQAGVGAGFFAYDPRLESDRDGRLAPLPGVSVDAGAGGVFTLRPSSR